MLSLAPISTENHPQNDRKSPQNDRKWPQKRPRMAANDGKTAREWRAMLFESALKTKRFPQPAPRTASI